MDDLSRTTLNPSSTPLSPSSLLFGCKQKIIRSSLKKKDPIPTYLALKHGFPVSRSADVITLRLNAPLPDTGKTITVQTAIQVWL